MAIKRHPSFAVHPGAWLRTEIVAPHGLSVTELAGKLGVTRQAMSRHAAADAAAHDLAQARAHEGDIRVERVAG